MSRKISSYFLVKPKESSSKKVELDSLSTVASENAEESESDHAEEKDDNRVDENAINENKNIAGNSAETTVMPNQPHKFEFPKKDYGRQTRSFQSSWFKDFPWFHYDEISDSAFCYICISQNNKGNLTSARNKEQSFISTGYSNWKKALERFKEHQTSECHKVALTLK